MDLLTRAVDALKAGKQPDLDITAQKGTEIELQLPAFIPDHYLGDVQLRLQCYKRIASAKSASELDEIQVDMIDRFGLLPDNAKLLFELALLKQKAESLGIVKIEANSKTGKIEFSEKPTIDPMKLIKLIQTQSHRYRLEGPTRLRFTLDSHEITQRIVMINQLIEMLIARDPEKSA
jgi:transcription-repair coupling factor (superfamily II helicase)